MSAITLKLSNKIEDNTLNQYHLHFLIIGLTVMFSILLPQLIKLIWERPRPYVVLGGEQFQAWYVGFNLTFDNAYKSFPSGHSAVAASLRSLIVFKSELRNRTYVILKYSLFFYVFLMMISRMIRGDHYLSDVLFGVLIPIFSFILIKNTYVKKT